MGKREWIKRHENTVDVKLEERHESTADVKPERRYENTVGIMPEGYLGAA